MDFFPCTPSLILIQSFRFLDSSLIIIIDSLSVDFLRTAPWESSSSLHLRTAPLDLSFFFLLAFLASGRLVNHQNVFLALARLDVIELERGSLWRRNWESKGKGILFFEVSLERSSQAIWQGKSSSSYWKILLRARKNRISVSSSDNVLQAAKAWALFPSWAAAPNQIHLCHDQEQD